MSEPLVTLEASTLEELEDVLTRLSKKDTHDCLYSALALGDPQFLLYPFKIKGLTFFVAKKQVCNEIKQIFSMPIKDIDYDFQIFHQDPGYITGVCAAIPKKVIGPYLKILDKNKLVPSRIVPYSAAIIDYYFQKYKGSNTNFCIIDFSKKYLINLGVFKEGHCELLRHIQYEFLHDVKSEIIDSLKNACILSGIQKFDHIYIAGILEDKLDIISEIEAAFQAKAERDHSVDVVTALSLDDYYFRLNFAHRYAFSPIERLYALRIANLVLALCCLIVIFLGSKIVFQLIELRDLNTTYTLTDHDYAYNLKKEMDSF